MALQGVPHARRSTPSVAMAAEAARAVHAAHSFGPTQGTDGLETFGVVVEIPDVQHRAHCLATSKGTVFRPHDPPRAGSSALHGSPPRLCRELSGMHKEPYFDAIALVPAILPRQCHRAIGHVGATFCPIGQLISRPFCLGVRGGTAAMRFCLTTKETTLAACIQCVTGRRRAIRCADEYMASIVLSDEAGKSSMPIRSASIERSQCHESRIAERIAMMRPNLRRSML